MTSAAPPSSRSRLIDYTSSSRLAQPPPAAFVKSDASASRAALLHNGQRFTAAVVVAFIFGTTALSLYDLYLFLTLVAR